MPFFAAIRKRKAFFLLLTCICLFVAGAAILTIGALYHVNPGISFAGLFKLEPYINLVSSVFVSY